MNIRLKRLMSDYEKIKNEFDGSNFVTVTPIGGNPPERYRVVYRLKSLRWDSSQSRPVEHERHEVEIYLPQNYPREKPQCLIHSPIFHPNFSINHNPNMVCIGDHWAAGNSLVDVIVQIGEMIQFQTYNVKSPLNAVAARWSLENERYFPLGRVNLYKPDPQAGVAVNRTAKEAALPGALIVDKKSAEDIEIELQPASTDNDDIEISFG